MKCNHSRLNAYLTCERYFWWEFVQNLIPKRVALPLLVGAATHQGLATHYTPGTTKAQVEAAIHAEFEEVRSRAAFLERELEELRQQEEYTKFVVERYQEYYQQEPWQVLAPEVQGHTALGPHEFYYRTDAVIAWRGSLYLLEHKTTSQLGANYFKKFANDGQITSYIWAVGKQLGQQPKGAVINAIVKSKNLLKVEFARDVVFRPEAQVQEYMTQRELLAGQIEDQIQSAGDQKVAWIMNTQECVRFNRTCDYLPLCLKDNEATREGYVTREQDYTEEVLEV